MAKRVTMAVVNTALREAGHPERLARGVGYFYFVDGEASSWRSSSVCVFNLGDLTVGEWVAERDRLASAVRTQTAR